MDGQNLGDGGGADRSWSKRDGENEKGSDDEEGDIASDDIGRPREPPDEAVPIEAPPRGLSPGRSQDRAIAEAAAHAFPTAAAEYWAEGPIECAATRRGSADDTAPDANAGGASDLDSFGFDARAFVVGGRSELRPPGTTITCGRWVARRLARFGWYNPNEYGIEGGDIEYCNAGNGGVSGTDYHIHAGGGMTQGTLGAGGAGSQRPPPPRPSLEKAWSYFERCTLPNTEARRLFPVWETSLRDLVRFGVSNQIFFSTLLVFSGILFLAGVLNVPLMVYFSGYSDSDHKDGVDYMGWGISIRASALCDSTEWVSCPSCHLVPNEYPEYRLRTVAEDDGTISCMVRRSSCDFSGFLLPGVLSYTASMLMLALASFFLFKQRRAEIVIDESVQTASDYSIKISNPPADALDPEEWKQYFDQFVDANEDRTTEVVESVEVDESDQFGPRMHRLTHKRGSGVVLVTVAIDNSELIESLTMRRRKLEALRKLMQSRDHGRFDEVIMDNTTSMDSIEMIVNELSSMVQSESNTIYRKCHRLLSGLGLLSPTDPRVLWEEIVALENDVRSNVIGADKKHRAVSVFVTFDSERTQRNALHALSTGRLNIWRNKWRNRQGLGVLGAGGQIRVRESVRSSRLWSVAAASEAERTIQLSFHSLDRTSTGASLQQCLLFRGEHVLSVAEAPEPNDVRWSDLQSSAKRKVEMQGWSALGMFVFVCWSGFFIYRLSTNHPGPYAAMFITMTNTVVPLVCEFISECETHATEHGKQLSLYVKITLFRWFNSAIALSLMSTFIETISVEDGNEAMQQSLMYKVYPVIVAELFFNPLLDMMDLPENFRRHFLAPRAGDQAEMNACFTGGRFWLAERYTNANRVLFVALFFSSILPESLFLGAMALLAQYHVGKFALLRLCGPAPDVGFHLAQFSRNFFFPAILVIHVTMSAYWWSGYPYDQVCDNGDEGYVACNQNFFGSHTFPPLPRFQPHGAEWMSEGQELITSLYGWTSVFVVTLALALTLRLNIIPWIRTLYESTYEPDGMDQGISFSKVTHCREVHGYILQSRAAGFLFPLLTCDIEGIDKNLVGWTDKERGHEPHNLVQDALALLGTKQLPPIFSVVKQWTK